MSILTHKMIKNRYSPVSSNLKAFFPCDLGYGNTITDDIGGIVITDDVSIEHTDLHAPAIIVTANSAISGASWPAIAEGQSFILFLVAECVTASAGMILMCGNTTGARLTISPASCAMEDDSGVELNISRLTAAIGSGVSAMIALTYDRVNNIAAKYDAVGSSSVAKNGADVDASSITDAITPADQVTFSTGIPQKWFGVGMYVFDGALPSQSEIETELDWIYNQLIIGNKVASVNL